MRRLILVLLLLGIPYGLGGLSMFYIPRVIAHFRPKPIDVPEVELPENAAFMFSQVPTVYAPAPKNAPPHVVAVGPYHWTVTYVKFGPGEYGRSYPKLLEIQLDPTLPHDQLVETLLHEIFHACMFIGNGGMVGADVKPEYDDPFIEQTAPTLVQVFRDNPELVKWLATKD